MGIYEEHRFKSPLFESVVGQAVSFFELTPISDLPPDPLFNGVGVYGLYYIGKYTLYNAIADPSYARPIYVGKAVPTGWRMGRIRSKSASALSGRLRQHARSI